MKAGGKINWKVLCTLSDNLVRGVAFHKDSVYAVTHTGAPRYKLVRTSLDHPDWAHAETVSPEAKDSIQSIAMTKDFLFVVYSNGILGRVVKYAFANGKTSEVKLPGAGTVDVDCPDGARTAASSSPTSWTRPTTIYDLDARQGHVREEPLQHGRRLPRLRRPRHGRGRGPGTRRHDGPALDRLPEGHPARREQQLHPEGYGAYGISATPHFNFTNPWRCTGVVLAYCPPAGRQRKGRGLVQGGLQDHEAEHLEGLHLVRGIPREEGLHESRPTRGHRHQRGRHPDQPRHHRPPGPLRGRGLQRRLRERHAHGVLAERPRQHARSSAR